MSTRHAFSLIGAALLSCAAIAFAHTTNLTTVTLSAASDDTPVTLVGCIMKESDYRRQHDIGSGGWLNTGAGTSNEYVLVDAHPGPVNELTPAQADCSTMSGGRNYELKGGAERQRNLEPFLGRRIEISGRLQHADTEVTVGTSGEVVATRPTGGFDPSGRDLRLFEVKVDSFREIPIAQPVAALPPAAAPAAPEPAPAPQAAVPTVQEEVVIAETPARTLPRTASPLALSALLGLLSLGGAFGLRTWRLR